MSAWTFIAQRALTGEFLDWDVPIHLDGLEWELSGPGALTGTVTPDVGGLRADDGSLLLQEWGTLLYAESGGEIRWGGILISCSFNGEAWDLEAAGFGTYPHARTFPDLISAVGIDVATAIRTIWATIQATPDGDLGVEVTGAAATGTLLGTAAWTEHPTPTAEDPTPEPVEHEAEPYQLGWFEAPNCGSEIDDLTKLAPLDWTERHRWSEDRESILHEVRLHYPRAGRRREDLLFSQGDNITDVVAVESNGDDFSNVVIGLGAGEGTAMLRREIAVRDGRLRREHTYADKAITDSARLDALIAAELTARRAALRITSLSVIDHPNARLGSWEIGDDVLVRAGLPWLGEIEMWVRITAWQLTGEHTATLTVSRSDLFRYGG